MFRGRSRWIYGALVSVAVVTILLATPAHAQDPPVAVPGEICSTIGAIPELGGRVCAGFEAGSVLLAGVCQQLGLPSSTCGLVDATPPDESTIAAYEDSWVHRALRLQEQLGRDEPLMNSLVPHTHNSANSTAYGPSVSTFDPNQRYSIGDQLRMDMGGIELDLHLVGGEVVLCHGTSVPIDDLVVHVGCSIDTPLAVGLAEIKDVLDTAGNEERVVLVYLENQLDDDVAAHDDAVATVNAYLGDRVYRPAPTGDQCDELPMEMSRQDVLDAGAQVVLVGNCGPGDWSQLVFERGQRWQESGYDGDYPVYPDCLQTRSDEGYDDNFIRHWEDLTFVSAVAEGTIHHLTPDVVHRMVRCGVDMIGFDRLAPFDGRLEALVWSWAPDQPSLELAESCTYRAEGGRFFTDADCTATRPFACRDVHGDWSLAPAGAWTSGDAACAALGTNSPADPRFAVPATGWDNERLGGVIAAAGGDAVWLNLGRAPSPAPVAVPSDGEATTGSSLPATGGTVPVLAALAVAAAAVTTRSRLDPARMYATPLQESSQDRGRDERCMR